MGVVLKQSFRNSISFYIGMVIGAINTIIIYPNVFNDNPEYFGLIQILLAYSILISTFTTIGIPKIFIRFYPKINNKGQLYFLSLITPIIGFLIALSAYIFLKDYIFDFLNASNLLRENFYYILILVFLIGFYEVLTAISRSFLSSVAPVFVNEVFLKVYSVCILILYWYDFFDFEIFLQVYLFGYFLKFLILFCIQFFNNRLEFTLSLKDLEIKEMFSYGLYVLAGGASILIVTRLDMMMLGALLDLQQVAFYTVAFFIGNTIIVPAKSISAISLPLISKAFEIDDLSKIQILYSKSSINQLLIGGLFFLCIWLNIDEIFSLLPVNFQSGKWVVFYIGLSQLFNMASGVNGEIIINSKFYRYDLYSNLFLVIISFITNYILIQKYGINGAAVATSLSILAFNITRLSIIKIKLNMNPFSLQTIYTIILLLVLYYFLNFLPISNIPLIDIIYRSFVACILFIPLVFFLKISDDINKIINDIKFRIFNRE